MSDPSSEPNSGSPSLNSLSLGRNAPVAEQPSANQTVPATQVVQRSWDQYLAPNRDTAQYAGLTTTGRSPVLLVLGEAPAEEDARTGRPFMGAAGSLLRKDLFPNAGLDYYTFHVLNVFTQRLPGNDIKNLTLNKTEYRKALGTSPPDYPPPLAKRYLHPDHYWQLEELNRRLEELRPDFIICLGATALWAVTGESGIANFRGTVFPTKWGQAIATYHPAAVLREWSFRPICWADLTKARLFLEGALPKPLRREVWINPTWQEIEHVYEIFAANPSWRLGVDIETCPSIDQITTISFSTPTLGICIPIWDRHAKPSQENYWQTAAEEVKAWRWINRFAQLPNPKVAQNGLYDTQYCLDAPIEIRFRNLCDDTAILQHSLQPELPKALGFLSSLYLNEPSWKNMRAQAKDAKVDE